MEDSVLPRMMEWIEIESGRLCQFTDVFSLV